MRVLNVGGGASRELPAHYAGWEQVLLDIDETCKPDLCMDARDIVLLTDKFDAVYCSHNLEHFYSHDVPKVLKGFLHVLKPEGFAEIVVPNLKFLMSEMASHALDLDDVWYRTQTGQAVTFHDVLYGWNEAMKEGNLYYAHKSGFTPMSLNRVLERAGFVSMYSYTDGSNLRAIAYPQKHGAPTWL